MIVFSPQCSPEVHALLLSDVFVFLQEKDQKYVYAMLVGSCYHLLHHLSLNICLHSFFLLFLPFFPTIAPVYVIFSYPTVVVVVVVSISWPS